MEDISSFSISLPLSKLHRDLIQPFPEVTPLDLSDTNMKSISVEVDYI